MKKIGTKGEVGAYASNRQLVNDDVVEACLTDRRVRVNRFAKGGSLARGGEDYACVYGGRWSGIRNLRLEHESFFLRLILGCIGSFVGNLGNMSRRSLHGRESGPAGLSIIEEES
ncbi:hypothetical protein Ancab_024653 [Ancistrocladus abbreviatus]